MERDRKLITHLCRVYKVLGTGSYAWLCIEEYRGGMLYAYQGELCDHEVVPLVGKWSFITFEWHDGIFKTRNVIPCDDSTYTMLHKQYTLDMEEKKLVKATVVAE